jgi:nucleoside-diphosphate-sugar epimerase
VKIVLAGGRGFIGSRLAERLRAQHTVVVWDLPEVNLLDVSSFSQELERLRPDLVVNLAAVLGGVQAKNIGEIFETNFGGNLNLVEQCASRGVRRYVFASSLTVHGSNPPEEPCVIESPFDPKHAYGASKAAAEHCLVQYAKRFGMAVVALRPTLVLGDTRVPHAPIDFLQTLLGGRRIEIFGPGTHQREWIWIDDAVEGFVRAVDFCARTEQAYYPFFLGGNRITMRDLAFKCAAQLSKGSESVEIVDGREQAFTLTCDLAETERILGWKARWDLDAMISSLVRILSQRSERAQ